MTLKPTDGLSETIEEQIKYVFGLVRASSREADPILVKEIIKILNTSTPNPVRDFSPLGYQKSGGSGLRKILDDWGDLPLSQTQDDKWDSAVAELKSAIKQHYLDLLPEKKGKNWSFLPKTKAALEYEKEASYNQAIKDFRERIENE